MTDSEPPRQALTQQYERWFSVPSDSAILAVLMQLRLRLTFSAICGPRLL